MAGPLPSREPTSRQGAWCHLLWHWTPCRAESGRRWQGPCPAESQPAGRGPGAIRCGIGPPAREGESERESQSERERELGRALSQREAARESSEPEREPRERALRESQRKPASRQGAWCHRLWHQPIPAGLRVAEGGRAPAQQKASQQAVGLVPAGPAGLIVAAVGGGDPAQGWQGGHAQGWQEAGRTGGHCLAAAAAGGGGPGPPPYYEGGSTSSPARAGPRQRGSRRAARGRRPWGNLGLLARMGSLGGQPRRKESSPLGGGGQRARSSMGPRALGGEPP